METVFTPGKDLEVIKQLRAMYGYTYEQARDMVIEVFIAAGIPIQPSILSLYKHKLVHPERE